MYLKHWEVMAVLVYGGKSTDLNYDKVSKSQSVILIWILGLVGFL